ncbi:MAG TPA: DUF1579 domain-containing protein [Thermoanaerobaculia bacterium]|nr:DUF1579 domain-containing protein [Thermoanaerobaculia bacterium]
MNRRTTFLFVLAGLLVAGAALAADPPKAQEGSAHEQMSADMQAMMKAATPGEQHKLVGRLVGDWTYTIQMYMAPGQPPVGSSGTMHADWLLGGRYVESVYKGDFMGQPFEGHGVNGYDNVQGKYVGTWIDNAGTGIMNSTGTCDAGCKSETWSGDMFEPTSGQKISTTSTVTWADDDHFKMEAFMPDGKGGSFKTMELSATKKK